MVSLPLSLCVCVCARARGWAGTCAGGVRFSNSNRIIPSDYRILLLLKMPIPSDDGDDLNTAVAPHYRGNAVIVAALYIYIYI